MVRAAQLSFNLNVTFQLFLEICDQIFCQGKKQIVNLVELNVSFLTEH